MITKRKMFLSFSVFPSSGNIAQIFFSAPDVGRNFERVLWNGGEQEKRDCSSGRGLREGAFTRAVSLSPFAVLALTIKKFQIRNCTNLTSLIVLSERLS